MKKEEFDTIYEDVLAAALKLMYLMRQDKKFNIDTSKKNYYKLVLEELKTEGVIKTPDKEAINELYKRKEKEEDINLGD